MTALYIEDIGAVTPVGFSAAASCAAIRARISRIGEVAHQAPPHDGSKAGRVKAASRLRRTQRDWLLNMASLAIDQCSGSWRSAPVALFVCLPESSRAHPEGLAPHDAIPALAERCRLQLVPESRALPLGAAGLAEAIAAARHALLSQRVECCVVGGVDSLVNSHDIDRLEAMGRLHGEGNSQGVIPGEGAVFLVLSTTGRLTPFAPLARLRGCQSAAEPDSVESERYSVGNGMTHAVKSALDDGRLAEADVSFVVSDHNGERYTGWETTMAHARTYRTRRERLHVTYPAASVGHLGAAAAPLALMVATFALARGYAPGPHGVCEFRSESELRGACVLSSDNQPLPFVSWTRRRSRTR